MNFIEKTQIAVKSGSKYNFILVNDFLLLKRSFLFLCISVLLYQHL